jgi:hypothetical protein
MRKFLCLIIIITGLVAVGCAQTGKPRTNYGGQVRLPQENNYTTPSQVPVVPLPGESKEPLTTEALTKQFYYPYSDLFTASLKALRNLNYSLMTFNSSSGVIEFQDIQGAKLYLRLAPDQEFSTRSIAKLQSEDGSRRIDPALVENVFNAIVYYLSNTQ